MTALSTAVLSGWLDVVRRITLPLARWPVAIVPAPLAALLADGTLASLDEEASSVLTRRGQSHPWTQGRPSRPHGSARAEPDG
jgi:hypothetical protein